MRDFLPRLFLFLLPVALLLAGVNVGVDPAGLYRTELETAMATRLLAGEAVGVNRNFNDRLLQRLLASGHAAPPDLLVLGSSTSMELTPENFCLPATQFFNASVSGAALEDLLAIYWLHTRTGFPEKLVIETPPRLFAPAGEGSRWRTLIAETNQMRAVLGLVPLPAATLDDPRLTNLFSPTLFQEALGLALSGRVGPPDLAVASGKAVKYPDGAQLFPPTAWPDAAGVARLTSAYLAENPVFPASVAERVALFEGFIGYAVQRSEVAFYLPPYSPTVFDAYDQQAYRDYVAALERLAAVYGVVVLGGHDPAQVGLTGADYRDGVHPLKPALDRFFSPQGCGWAGE